MTRCPSRRVLKGARENIVQLIYGRKSHTSNPFFFIVQCCYNSLDDLRLSHSDLLESKDIKNLRGCSLERRHLVGFRRGPLDWQPELHSRSWIARKSRGLFLTPTVASLEPPSSFATLAKCCDLGMRAEHVCVC